MNESITINCCRTQVAIQCNDRSILEFFGSNFAALRFPVEGEPEFSYRIECHEHGYVLTRINSEVIHRAANVGELTYYLESDLVVQLQLARPDLLFIHAAVLCNDEFACVITGSSGAGKSTTCWAMLHHGYRYISDELAPVSLDSMTVRPYSHALCLKRRPSDDYPLPPGTLTTQRGFHIPTATMPLTNASGARRIRHLVFVQYSPANERPEISSVTQAEAAARLYPNVLNALAHDNNGLAAVAHFVARLSCVLLKAADLKATATTLAAHLAGSSDPSRQESRIARCCQNNSLSGVSGPSCVARR